MLKKARLILLAWVVCLIACPAPAQVIKCSLCDKVIVGRYRKIEDQITHEKKNFCLECSELPDRCFACDLPIKEGGTKLQDGRFLCARDEQVAVNSPDEAKDICQQTKLDIDRLFSRFMTFPGDNVNVSVVDKFHLQNLFTAPGYQNTCASYYGATASNPLPGGKFMHSIDLLSNLRKSRLMAVCSHEYTHVWMAENVSPERKAALDPNTVEAFCELVAYKYMDNHQETSEMDNIKRNTYTKGQIDVLLAADERYGFNTVIEWIKNGEDNRLALDNLDRVRALKDATYIPVSTSLASYVIVGSAVPKPVAPSTLTLKGIMGAGRNRFAMINDGTLGINETGRVHVGESNVVVRCLEIHDDSVVIQVQGSNEKKELFFQLK